MSQVPSLSLILPIYRPEDVSCAQGVIDEIRPVLEKMGCEDFEFLIPCCTNIGESFREGVRQSSKAYIGVYSAYNQINPKTLTTVLPMLGKTDMVIGYIANPYSRTFFRRVYSWVNVTLVNWLFGQSFKYYHFCFIKTEAVQKVPISTSSHAAITESILWLAASGASHVQAPVHLKPHNFPSKSGAFRISNVIQILSTYAILFKRLRIGKEKISL